MLISKVLITLYDVFVWLLNNNSVLWYVWQNFLAPDGVSL